MKELIKSMLTIAGVTFLVILYCIGMLLPFKIVSHCGGWLARKIGPLSSLQKTALINLKIAFPNCTDVYYASLLEEMWDNLGRTLFEYIKLPGQKILQNTDRFHVEGLHYLQEFKNDDKPGLLLTIHQANWELGNYLPVQQGIQISQVIRFINNPLIRRFINFVQGHVVHELIPKGSLGARLIIERLKNKKHISMMMDQKLNEGLELPFFNHPAKTATAMVKLAYKYQCPILPVQVIRYQKTKFKIIYHPFIWPAQQTGDQETVIFNTLLNINKMIECWIKENPGQWYWIHKRFDKAIYKNKLS